MKRFKILLCACFALATAAALVGCSSTPKLDNQVTVEGMTLSVPSKWLQQDGAFNDTGSNSLGRDGQVYWHPSDNSGYIGVDYSVKPTSRYISSSKSAADLYNDQASIMSSLSGFDQEQLDDQVVDSKKAEIHKTTIKSDKGTTVTYYAGIDASGTSYLVSVNNDEQLFKDVLESISFN